MADSTTRAIRQFFETRARASAAREAYDHWTWNVDPGADYRTREQDRMANTLADLCLCLDDLCDQAESEMRRCSVADPLIPIGRPAPQPSLRSSLLAYAEREMPNLGGSGMAVAVQVIEGQGVIVSGVVQWRESLTGRVVYTRRVTGERDAKGEIVWRF